MKKSASLAAVVACIIAMIFNTGVTLAQQSKNVSAGNMPTGIWLGSLKPAPDVELRIAITIKQGDNGELSATLNSIDQGSQEIPCDVVTSENDNIKVAITKIGIEVEGPVDVKNNTWKSEFRQSGMKLPIDFARVDNLPGFNRPQTPVKPYPYNEEEVTYENAAAGVKLAGTLTYPKSGGPFPAVILLTGSGKQERDEEAFGHKVFLVLADYLTRQGLAVLRADDRGAGGSTGDFRNSTTGDFADDALAGVAYLKTLKEIDSSRIGLLGHSEGGMMAPIAAAKSPDVAFIVMFAGPGEGFDDIIVFQMEKQLKMTGMSADDLALQRSWHKSLYAVSKSDLDSTAAAEKIKSLFAKLTDNEKKRLGWNEERLEKEIPGLLWPWWRYAMAYDPQATLRNVTCPVLAIIGDKDQQVPSQPNIPLIEKALREGGNKNYTVKEIPDKNHLFQTAKTGDESEYAKIEETISPDVLKLVADWILANSKSAVGSGR